MRPEDGLVFFAQAEKSFRNQYQQYVDACIEALFELPAWEKLKTHRDLFRFQRDLFKVYLRSHYLAEAANNMIVQLKHLGEEQADPISGKPLYISNQQIIAAGFRQRVETLHRKKKLPTCVASKITQANGLDPFTDALVNMARARAKHGFPLSQFMDADGNTPLHSAFLRYKTASDNNERKRAVRIINCLYRQGADPMVLNRAGQNAYVFANFFEERMKALPARLPLMEGLALRSRYRLFWSALVAEVQAFSGH